MTVDLTQIGRGVAQSATESDAIERMRRLADAANTADSPDSEAIRKQAVEFEGLFVKMMLNAMRKTVNESDLFGDPSAASRSVYRSMLDNEYASIMAANQSFGIADALLGQFGLEPERAPEPNMESAIGMLGGVGADGGSSKMNFVLPAVGRISSPFGMRSDPISGQLRMHEGVDLAMPIGRRVHAAASGEVAFVGEKRGYGKVAIVEHRNGYRTVYAHLDSLEIEAGDRVSQGQVIARSGNTGRSTGPHLHFEMLKDGRPVNPAQLVKLR